MASCLLAHGHRRVPAGQLGIGPGDQPVEGIDIVVVAHTARNGGPAHRARCHSCREGAMTPLPLQGRVLLNGGGWEV